LKEGRWGDLAHFSETEKTRRQMAGDGRQGWLETQAYRLKEISQI